MLTADRPVPPSRPQSGAHPEIEVPAGWLRLALHAGEPEFFEKLADLLAAESGAEGVGVWMLVQTARGNGLAAKAARGLPDGPEWEAWLHERLREVVARRVAFTASMEAAGVCAFVPLVWEKTGLGVAMLSGPRGTSARIERLGLLAGWALRLHVRDAHTPAGAMDQSCSDALLASAHSAEWPAILATHLRRQSGASRASLLRERGGRWRVVAASGAGEVKRRSAEARAIEQEFSQLNAAGAAAGKRALALRCGSAAGWGMLLEFERDHVPDEARVRRGLAGLVQVAERVLPQVPEHGWRLALSRALVNRSRAPRGSRWVLAGVAALLVVAAFFPVAETFEGDCELQPSQRATVVSEVEGRVTRIAVAEGALVKRGDVLAQLDASIATTRLEVVREQRQEQEAEARRFQSQQDMTGYRLAKLKAAQSAQEEASLLEDIRRSTLVAPLDGKVLTKDLAQKEGTVLRVGDVLCDIGSTAAWNLEIAVPEEALAALLAALERRSRLPVSYRLKAGSTYALDAEVSSARQVSEMAYPVDGRNVIYVTVPGVAIPTELLPELRPGFSGRAKIEGSSRPWAAILTHRFAQYLRLHWWL